MNRDFTVFHSIFATASNEGCVNEDKKKQTIYERIFHIFVLNLLKIAYLCSSSFLLYESICLSAVHSEVNFFFIYRCFERKKRVNFVFECCVCKGLYPIGSITND